MKHIFIVNPCAGKADATATLIPGLIEQLASLGVDYAIELTGYPGHATEIARRWAMTRDPIRFYACGGDGTLNEVLAGAYQYPDAEVACVPLGSGNDMLRNFGIKEEFADIPDLVDGRAVDIDLMAINDRIGAAICSVGLDADVANSMPHFRRMPLVNGSMAYGLSILENFVKHMGYVMSITVDEQTFVGEYMLAAIANGSYYGGGVCAAPTARMDDGLLDVILVKKFSRLRIPTVIGQYMKGEHLQGGEVAPNLTSIITFCRGRHITMRPERSLVANIDGECTPETDLEIQVLPRAARFVLPCKVYDRYMSAAGEAKEEAVV